MKIKCKVCRKETEINELGYTPGDRISIECIRCGNELEVTIPEREEELSINPQPKSTKQGFTANGGDSIISSSIISSKEDLESIWYAAGRSKTTDADIEDKRPNKDTSVVVSSSHEQVSSNSSSKNPNVTSSTPVPTSSATTTYSNSIVGKRSKSKDTAESSGRIMFFIIIGIIFVVGSIWLLHNEYSNPHNSKPTYSYGNDSDSAEAVVTAVAEIMDYSEDTAIEETGVIDYETQNANDTCNAEFFHHGHGYISTKSGLKYVTVIEGSGASPSEDAVVTVHYIGMLTDGTIFDSSYERDEPASFPLKGVIRGWSEGLQNMKVGGKTVFYIPSHLAYGEQGTPGGPIGPNEDLIFEVELLGINN